MTLQAPGNSDSAFLILIHCVMLQERKSIVDQGMSMVHHNHHQGILYLEEDNEEGRKRKLAERKSQLARNLLQDLLLQHLVNSLATS
jgi:hypothetical protein